MNGEVERLFRSVRAPDESAAGDRAASVALAAFSAREVVPRKRRDGARAAVIALVLAGTVAAIAVTPAGSWIRDAIGRERVVGVKPARPALTSLPAPGRLLVTSSSGVWVVRRDGSRRYLGDYEGASWSPTGLFVVAWRGRELAALEPDRTGAVRWSLSRGRIADARWAGREGDTRIGFRSGSSLRVVAGDGTGDRELAPRVASLAPAWRPGPGYVLAYVDGAGRITVVGADTGTVQWRSGRLPPLVAIAWSSDGSRLFAASRSRIRVFGARGGRRAAEDLPISAGRLTALAAGPTQGQLAYVTFDPATGGSRALLADRRDTRVLVAGQGRFTGPRWSPDGRYVLVGWQAADQWLFLPTKRGGRLLATSNIAAVFAGEAAPDAMLPRVEGWCC